MRAYQAEGFTVVPINPHEREVEGMRAYASVLDVEGPIDIATVYVQPNTAIALLPEFEQKQIGEIWMNPGAESDAFMAEAAKRGLNVVYACSILGIGRSPGQFD